jgi:hypothetical protein
VLQRRHVLLLLHGVRQLRLSYCCPAKRPEVYCKPSIGPDTACAGVSSLLAGWAVASDESIATHNFLLPIQASVPTLSTAAAPTVLFLCQLPCLHTHTHYAILSTTETVVDHRAPQPPKYFLSTIGADRAGPTRAHAQLCLRTRPQLL